MYFTLFCVLGVRMKKIAENELSNGHFHQLNFSKLATKPNNDLPISSASLVSTPLLCEFMEFSA